MKTPIAFLVIITATFSGAEVIAELAELRLADGTRLENVTITAVTADGIKVSHKDGAGLIRVENLPPDLQAKFAEKFKPENSILPAPASIPVPEKAVEPTPNLPSEPAVQSEFDSKVTESKKLAADRYPSLKDSSSTLHQLVAEATRKRVELRPRFYDDPNWPLELADAVAATLAEFQKAQKTQAQADAAAQAQQNIKYMEAILAITKDPKKRAELQQMLALYRATVPSPPAAQAAPAIPAGDSVESSITGEFKGWEGETIFKLDNGQIWQQARYAYHYAYKFHPKVLIYPSKGAWQMKVDGVEATITVKRIR